MEFRNSLKKSLVFFLLIFLIGFSLAEIKFSETILSEEKEGITTMTFQGSDFLELITLSDGKTYGNAKPNSFIKIVNDSVLEADLTALKEASWTFGNDTIKVQEGMRVVYKNGTLEVFGKEKESIRVNQDFEGIRKLEFTKNDEGNLEIKGTNFNVDGIQVQQGSLSIVNGGYVLGKNSLADWEGLTLGNGKDLFLATSESAYNSWEGSALFPEELRLRGKGEGFMVKFNEGNSWAIIDPEDNFQIKAGKGFEFSLENRNPDIKQEGKIPLMNIKGEFMMNQDSKTIYTNNGEILITKQKDGVLFNKDMTKSGSSTSPIELIVDGQKNRYIVSNFNGVATVPLNEENKTFRTDERYANSIYWKRASVENRYNYPTKADLSKIEGKEFNFVGMPEDPEIIRTILEVYEANPEAFKDLKGIDLMSTEKYIEIGGKLEFAGHWDPRTGTISIKGFDDSDDFFGLLLHEVAHDDHLAQRTMPEYTSIKEEIKKLTQIIPIQNEVLEYLPKHWTEQIASKKEEIQKLNERLNELNSEKRQWDKKLFIFDNDWRDISKIDYKKGEFVKGIPGGNVEDDWLDMGANPFLNWKNNQILDMDIQDELIIGTRWDAKSFIFDDVPQYGIIRPYGANNIKEDVATFIETIRTDPLFFKGYGLIDENLPSGEKSPFYDSRYKDKIDLLKKHGFITEAEYDAVFNPENYFSPEEIAELMKKK